jgi:hypothetical protein
MPHGFCIQQTAAAEAKRLQESGEEHNLDSVALKVPGLVTILAPLGDRGEAAQLDQSRSFEEKSSSFQGCCEPLICKRNATLTRQHKQGNARHTGCLQLKPLARTQTVSMLATKRATPHPRSVPIGAHCQRPSIALII